MRPEQHEELAADLEARLEEAVGVFREHHSHPANLALHAVGYAVAARGALRFFSGRFLSGIGHGLAAAGLVVWGHRIEGSDPLATARTLQDRWSGDHRQGRIGRELAEPLSGDERRWLDADPG